MVTDINEIYPRAEKSFEVDEVLSWLSNRGKRAETGKLRDVAQNVVDRFNEEKGISIREQLKEAKTIEQIRRVEIPEKMKQSIRGSLSRAESIRARDILEEKFGAVEVEGVTKDISGDVYRDAIKQFKEKNNIRRTLTASERVQALEEFDYRGV